METKPYYLSSEFWLALFGIVINLVNVVGIWDWLSNWHSGILMTIIMAAYAVARGQAKNGVPFDPVKAANDRRELARR